MVSCLVTYRVAPIPDDLTAPSVTIQSWSDRIGMDMVFVDFRLDFAKLKFSTSDSDRVIFSVDARPVVIDSNGEIMRLQPSITLLRALNAPMKDLMLFTVFGASAFSKGDI